MLYLTTFYDKDIFPTKKIEKVLQWEKRKTVKIILLNNENKIALVTNPIHQCHLLPGGGINKRERIFTAADRECREETGFSIISEKIIGTVKEYRARNKQLYETFGIVARVSNKTSEDLRTEDEKNNGLIVNWHTIDETKKILNKQYNLLKSGKIEFYNTGFNIARDKLFFETAQKNNLFKNNMASCTAFIFFNSKILLMLRDNNSKTVHPNVWGIIGGGIECGESPNEAIKRECKEEINIIPSQLCFIGKDGDNRYRYFAKLTPKEASLIKLGNEGQRLKFYEIEKLKELSLTPKMTEWVNKLFILFEYLALTKNPNVNKVKKLFNNL